MAKRRIAQAALIFAAILSLAAAGCGQSTETASDTEPSRKSAPVAAQTSGTVTMNGRSVMGGWMEHWGYDWEGPVEAGGYPLDYKELDGSAIPSSFAENVSGLEPGSVVFFKFCFEDFDGENLAEREREIDQVVEKAEECGLKLIIGNALPRHEEDSDPELLEEYRDFNAYLEQIAADNPDVWVYDFYGVLSGSDGWLKPEYDLGDSHLNEEAYLALDPSFFELLGEVSAR